MSPDEWKKIKFFTASEFDDKTVPGSGATGMDYRLVDKLDRLRLAWSRPIKITSGFRSSAHNAEVGGKPNSAHLRGLAADCATEDLCDAIKFAIFAAARGFTRVGVDLKGKYVHLDIDPSLPGPATWFYNV